MHTHRWLVVTPMAQMHRHTVCIGSLAVFTTEDVMLLGRAEPPTEEAHTLPVTLDDAIHIHTPMLECSVLRTAAR